jgi:UDP-glucose 4-epimerase
MSRSVLVTGSSGYLGSQVVEELATDPQIGPVIAYDIRTPDDPLPGVDYAVGDVRDPGLADVLANSGVGVVVHLAAIVTPGRKSNRDLEYSVDVLGTRNVLECCLRAGVDKIIISSSGAAYGYHADSPKHLTETDPLRGNESFAYSHHKLLVELMLADWRVQHPELDQLIFRPGTILGATAKNQITALFERPIVLGLRGADIPFVFIWDQDVVRCVAKGVREGKTGIFNLAGDGVLTMAEIAEALNKAYVRMPVWLVRGLLVALKAVRLTQYGPEQVDFLRYRPVLDNTSLKKEFGYTPELTTAEVFDLYRKSQHSDPAIV